MDSSTAICWPGGRDRPPRHRSRRSCPAAAPAPRPSRRPGADAATAGERLVIGGVAGFDQFRLGASRLGVADEIGDMGLDETGAEAVLDKIRMRQESPPGTGMLVATPPIRNSRSVRVALCTTSVQLPPANAR
jgi:hypothetical protein